MRSLLLAMLVSATALAAPIPSPGDENIDRRQDLDDSIGTLGVVISTTLGSLDDTIGTVSAAGEGNEGTVGEVLEDGVEEAGAMV